MGYQEALEIAGAKVHLFQEFGSYQGEWFAKVTYKDKIGWINGYYGSCSGCDSFEGEFGDANHDCFKDEYYNPFWGDESFKDNCPICQDLKKRFVAFGEDYLSDIMTYDEALAKASENLDWDMDAQEMVDFIKCNK